MIVTHEKDGHDLGVHLSYATFPDQFHITKPRQYKPIKQEPAKCPASHPQMLFIHVLFRTQRGSRGARNLEVSSPVVLITCSQNSSGCPLSSQSKSFCHQSVLSPSGSANSGWRSKKLEPVTEAKICSQDLGFSCIGLGYHNQNEKRRQG